MIYELILNPIFLIYLIFVLIYIAYGIKLYLDRQQKLRNELFFIQSFGNGLHSGMITTFDEVVNIYRASFHTDDDDLGYRYNLSNLLRTYLSAFFKTSGKVTLKDEDFKKMIERKKLLNQFIKENDSLSPYADLPSLERNILSDISKLVDSNEKELLKNKYIELASVLKTRYQEYNKNKIINRLSVPLAIIGFIINLYKLFTL